MTDSRLNFTARVNWIEGKTGTLEATDLPSINISAPVEFHGRDHTWTPEHLSVGAAASCYMATFTAVAEASRLAFKSLSIEAEGTVEKTDSGYELSEIVLRPALVVRFSKDVERAAGLLEKAKKHCIVSKAMRSRVTLEPRVYHEQRPACPCPAVEAPDEQQTMQGD
jgi:peroxiredoxin-like protein